MIKIQWLRFYDEAPPGIERTILVCDPSFGSKKPSADPCGIQVWGRRGPDFYLLDSVMERMDMPEMLRALSDMARKWSPTIKLVESKAAGTPILDLLKIDSPGWQGYEPRASKQERLAVVSPLFESGNVFLPSRVKVPWVDEVCTQLTQFPRCRHDEAVDLASMALSTLNDRGGDLERAMANVRAMRANGAIGMGGLGWLSGFCSS